MKAHSTLPALLIQAGLINLLAACGGGGGDGGTGNVLPDAQPITLTGQVVADQAIQGATVCLDLNANQQCDSGEPVSAATGSDGRYSLVTDPANTSADQAAPFAALLPATAVDAAHPGGPLASRALVFSAPAGKGAQINPLTTLVQSGVRAGLTPAAAESAVAVQLGVPVADLYDYQSQTAPTIPYPDNARTLAQVVLQALDAGQSLKVVDLDAPEVVGREYSYWRYDDAKNYRVEYYENTTDTTQRGVSRFRDVRTGMTSGSATSDSVLYATAYLAPSGWVRCDASGFSSTRGSPSRSAYCAGGIQQAGFTTYTDLTGRSMGAVIREMQAATDNSNTVNNLDLTLVDNALFPAGSSLDQRHNLEMGQRVWVADLNSTSQYLSGSINSSLETFIKGRQNANVNLGTNSGLMWLGLTEDSNHWLAGAFLDESSQVQYYRCTFTAKGFDVCTPATQGSFKIVTQHGVRLIKFSGQPNPVADINYTVGYGEYVAGSSMVRFFEIKPEARHLVTRKNRLNGIAGNALRQALGI